MTKERTCVACRKGQAEQMFRFVRHDDGEVVFDRHRMAFGRGANICPQRRCFELAFERKAFGRAFKKSILADRKVLESTVF
jgi:predicted RNA-binding protein YlxR (DUF448 family)